MYLIGQTCSLNKKEHYFSYELSIYLTNIINLHLTFVNWSYEKWKLNVSKENIQERKLSFILQIIVI